MHYCDIVILPLFVWLSILYGDFGHIYKKYINNKISQNKNGECTNSKTDVKGKHEQVNTQKNTMDDKNHKNVVKKNNTKYGYKNETIMIKDDYNKNTKLKCKHASINEIVNAKYDVNKNGPVARDYGKHTIGSMQENRYYDKANRMNKTYACIVQNSLCNGRNTTIEKKNIEDPK